MGNHNSGRRRYSEDALRRETIQQAWKVTHAHLFKDQGLEKDKVSIAKDIVLKSMPSEIMQDIKQSIELTQVEKDIISKYSAFNRIGQGN